MTSKVRTRSRRVTWPERGHNDGGEFRITLGRLVAIVTIVAALIGAFPAYWTISDHWMNRAEINKAMKDHADHDAGVQSWNQYGFAANRVEYLDDKIAECDAKKMTMPKLGAVDLAVCVRYESKHKSKSDEAATLKTKALESTKEKPSRE